MHRLRSAKWPVTLRFSRPLTDNDVTPLARCLQLEQQGELPDDLKLQMLKRLLSKGVSVKKHGSRKQAYDTVVYLNETMLFWRVRSRRPGVLGWFHFIVMSRLQDRFDGNAPRRSATPSSNKRIARSARRRRPMNSRRRCAGSA